MSGIGINASWTAPLQTQWDITNASCDPYSQFLAYLFASDAAQVDNIWTTVPVGVAVNFTAALVPTNWTPQPNAEDLLLWYLDYATGQESLTGDTLGVLINVTLEECNATICPYLGWEGDSDLSGIGVCVKTTLAHS